MRSIKIPEGPLFKLWLEWTVDRHPSFTATPAAWRSAARILAKIEAGCAGVLELEPEDWRMLKDAASDGKAGTPQGLVVQTPEGDKAIHLPPRTFLACVDAVLDASDSPPVRAVAAE